MSKPRRARFSLEKDHVLYSAYLFTTPMMPSLTGMTLPIRTSMASVPASIRSSLVTTARVLLPDGEKISRTHLVTLGHRWKTPVGETSAGTPTVGVSLPGHFQGLWGCHVRVGCSHSQDDGVWVGDVLKDQLPDLELNILWLISHRNLLEWR